MSQTAASAKKAPSRSARSDSGRRSRKDQAGDAKRSADPDTRDDRDPKGEGEGKGDRGREAKRLSILSAAAKIFNERGFHNTAMADVADALGVSKPFLYYYLKDKEDILAECSRAATQQLHVMLDEVRKADVSGWRKLEMAFRGYAEVMTTDFGVCLIRSTAPGSLPAKSREKLWSGRRRLNREIEVFIAQGIADGSIRSCDPKALSFALFGAFNWITFWYQSGGRMQPSAIADTFLDIFARGVVPPARNVKE